MPHDKQMQEWLKDPGFRARCKESLKGADPNRRGKVDDPAEIAERIRKLEERSGR